MPDRSTSFASVTATRNKSFKLNRLVASLVLLAVANAVVGTAVGTAGADDAFPACAPETLSEQFSVDYIHDGDTLWLNNGNKIRIIGLNAPETKRRDKPGEPLGKAARDALRGKIGDNKVYLEHDAQSHDRYGRQLAHIFLADKTNLTAWLIAQGFALAITVPPNLKYQACYQQSERIAREKNLGLWANDYFAPVPATGLARSGFMRVQGCVQEVSDYRNSLALTLSKRFRLRISAKDMRYLQPLLDDIGDDLLHSCMIVRGWVYNERKKKTKAMSVRHPNAIEFFDADE